MDKMQSFELAKAAAHAWRQENCTGQQLSPEKRAEIAALDKEINRLQLELAQEWEARIPVLPGMAEMKRNPLIRHLLIYFESGMTREDHLLLAFDVSCGDAEEGELELQLTRLCFDT